MILSGNAPRSLYRKAHKRIPMRKGVKKNKNAVSLLCFKVKAYVQTDETEVKK
jgi:hypothetical protein